MAPFSKRIASIWQRRPRRGLAAWALWLMVALGLTWIAAQIPGSIGEAAYILRIVISVVLLCVAIPLLVRLIRTHMLWSLRNKLVLTYLLIGLAPVVLLFILVGISAYIAAGQFAIHLADSRLQTELDQMSLANGNLLLRLVDTFGQSSPTAPPELSLLPGARRVLLRRHTELFLDGAPLTLRDPADHRHAIALGLPPWASDLHGNSFRSLVLDSGELFLVAIDQQRLNNGKLLSLVSSIPVDGSLLQLLAEGLGRAELDAYGTENRQNSSYTSVAGGAQPPRAGFADLRVRFLSSLAVIDWDNRQHDAVPIRVVSRPSLLYQQLFGATIGDTITSTIRTSLIALCILFAIIESAALWMAARLSSSITNSVTNLYDATQRIDRGELHHRISVFQADQLAELSRSFNRMTGSLQRLLEEQKNAERLQNELTIAQEVQANLFPTSIRNLPTLELHGVCRPARSVSGDYYDFLLFQKNGTTHPPVETGVGIALGDISGKGISAALLMATLHSAVRAYRFASESAMLNGKALTDEECHELFESPGHIMELLNRHIYRSTTPEKYATLFLAHYDAATSWLTYSNAGQLPPLLLRADGTIHRCEKGGTVVGLMDGMTYDEGRYQMHSGDILVAYSDGVTEPENDFGDFGEDRMMEVIRRYRHEPLHVISSQVMNALDAWIGAEEQPDDITLVLARQA